MNTFTLLAIAAILWSSRELVIGIFVWYSRKRFRNIYRIERTQRYFASARNELMRLALAQEVDVNTISFKSFYHINTAFMRRPDQYREISAAIVYLFLTDPHHSSPGEELLAESKYWTPAFRHVVKHTADAMGYLVLDYSLLMKVMFRLEKRHNPDSTPLRMLKRLASNVEKRKPVSDIRRSQSAMYRMAGTTPLITKPLYSKTLA